MNLKKRITAGVVAAMSCLTMAIPSISASAASIANIGKSAGEVYGYSYNYTSDLDACFDITSTFYADLGKFAAKNRTTLDLNKDGEADFIENEIEDYHVTSSQYVYNKVKLYNALGKSGLLTKYANSSYKAKMQIVENKCKTYTYAKAKTGQFVLDKSTTKTWTATDIQRMDAAIKTFMSSMYKCGHIIGDINTDGVVNKADYNGLTAYVQGKTNPFKLAGGDIYSYFRTVYDVNGDSRIDSTDTLLLMKYTK